MTDVPQARRTALYDTHVSSGARMVAFAGWEMPVQYSGVIAEHVGVRSRAGLFDVSHMGEATVRGPAALELLQWVTCNDVSRLTPGRAHYTALTTGEGTFVDDLLIYMLHHDEYLLVLNAGNTAKDLRWLIEHSRGKDVEVLDVSDRWALMAIQGPRAAEIVTGLTDADLVSLRSFRLVRAGVAGCDCIVARTGYTGEDGFELFCAPDDAPSLWARLMESGQPQGLAPAGLAARDTLRLEAKMALYGNDIDDSTTVLEADLAWIVKLDKGEFMGREALAAQSREGVSRKLVGFEMTGRGIARPGYGVFSADDRLGTVTSGTHAPWVKKNIGLAYLPRGKWEPGTPLEIEIRGRREGARVVPTPFYKRRR